MRVRQCSGLSAVLLVCWALAGVTGCGSQSAQNALAEANDSNLKRLANLYVRYQVDHGWRGPKNEQDFREYIDTAVPQFIKERIGYTTTDELFISSRDDQPFKIRFEVMGSSRGCFEPAIFEQVGRHGKRTVGFLNMVQRDVDEQEYNELWEGRFAPPAEDSAS